LRDKLPQLAELAARNIALAESPVEAANAGDAIPWQPYAHALLTQYTAAGKTVFVDFTADWCPTCKANEAVAIDRPETRRFIADNVIIALKADKTQPAPEVDELLRKLGNKAGSIPFYAVFPAAVQISRSCWMECSRRRNRLSTPCGSPFRRSRFPRNKTNS